MKPQLDLLELEPFATFDEQALASVRDSCRTLVFQSGECMPGKQADTGGAGILTRGGADLIVAGSHGGHFVCGAIGVGDLFGITAVMDNGSPLVAVVSRGGSECQWIEKPFFDRLLLLHPPLREYTYRLTAMRLAEACRAILEGRQEEPPANAPPAVKGAAAYIRAHYMQALDLETVAAACGMSRYHFSRLFKSCTGEGFKSYLNRVRVGKARDMMGLEGKNVSEACFAVGFNDLSYFARVFKSVFGMTPSTYRKGLLYGDEESDAAIRRF